MKKVALLAFVFIGLSFIGFSQEQNQGKPERIKLYPVSNETKVETPEQEIERLEGHLTALDEKEAWIRSNAEETRKATESGWFVNTEKTRQEINARLIELKK